jgi:hypothetical protein
MTTTAAYRLDVPRTSFFTLRLAEPRGTVRFGLGVAFLRAVRFAFLRSSLLSDFVFANSIPFWEDFGAKQF